ncbi:hypothetical protein CGZ93_14435 [Enemella dayhoffiae]|uniref:YdbS-like PH domain-containing protein n=1 Tax=Enemella dayhoffiae TaxID=2016507 RepID=A0A255GSQ3_9ACTN|nr:PH domain-containing protein [Enemella dayhoffiae]OYO18621.1 hypothetical protein CGZ93_14435 [Enemella dayhoffiae]
MSLPAPPPDDPRPPQTQATPEPGEKPPTIAQRPHPLTPLIRGWVVFVAIIVAFSQELIPRGGPRSGREIDWFSIWWIIALGILAVALLAGLVSLAAWWWTRYVIDDTELRIETGMLTRSSRRIPFGKVQSIDVIQPLAARLFGLCELRIEAGGGDSRVVLRYLKRDRAYQLRDYLLTRAHGVRTTLAESEQQPQADAFNDLASSDRILVRLQPPILVLGLVTSTEFIISVLAVLTAMAITWWLGVGVFAIGGLIPLIIGTLSMISRRVISQFNYTLAQTGGGALRITRGLTNLTSQSVPLDRIQGVRISQSWLWRHFLRLHRVDIDVLGYGHHDGTENTRSASSMLLPVARTEQVRLTMAHLLPTAADEQITLQRVPRRAAWLRPIGWRTLRYGWNEEVMVAESGWLSHHRDIVPHAKTQSVRLTQGPLQRRLRLATVHVDTTPGPVTQVLHHLDVAEARRIVDEQLPRAARARAGLP